MTMWRFRKKGFIHTDDNLLITDIGYNVNDILIKKIMIMILLLVMIKQNLLKIMTVVTTILMLQKIVMQIMCRLMMIIMEMYFSILMMIRKMCFWCTFLQENDISAIVDYQTCFMDSGFCNLSDLLT